MGQIGLPYNCLSTSQSTKEATISCLGRDRMVVGFTTTYAISAYHH